MTLALMLFACKKENPPGFPQDDPVSTEKVAEKVAGIYVGSAYLDGDYFETYELEVEKIGINRIRLEVENYETLEFDIMRDDITDIIMNTDTLNNHWVIWNEEATELHLLGQRTEVSGISFEGVKAE